MRKMYPKTEVVNGRHKCPECPKDFSDRSGFRYHWDKGHETKGKKKKVEEVLFNVKEVAKQVMLELPKLERLTPPVVQKGDLKPESWILLFGDLHYGQVVRENEVGGLSSYNPKIARERVNILLNKIPRIAEYHTIKPRELVIAFLGDIVDGSVLRGNQQSNIEFGVCRQVIEVVEILSDFIIALSQFFPKIRAYGVYGNHARLTANPKDAPPLENFDLLIYHFIQQRLKGLKDISVDYTESQHLIFELEKKKFWMEHGDTIKAPLGYSPYGTNRKKSNAQEMLSHFKENVDYFLFGHFHRKGNDLNIYQTGSFVGGDLFSIGRLTRLGMPVQYLLSVSEKYGVVVERPIQLALPEENTVKIYRS